jgi:CRP-like cAMP-binding protein
VRLGETEAELRETAFPEFTPVEFAKLMRIGSWREAQPGQVLTTQGAVVAEVIVVQSGELAVEIDGRHAANLKDGAIVGEMSFIAGKPATATVRAVAPTRYVAWPQPALRALLARNPAMLSAMRSVFSAELTRKLVGGLPA